MRFVVFGNLGLFVLTGNPFVVGRPEGLSMWCGGHRHADGVWREGGRRAGFRSDGVG